MTTCIDRARFALHLGISVHDFLCFLTVRDMPWIKCDVLRVLTSKSLHHRDLDGFYLPHGQCKYAINAHLNILEGSYEGALFIARGTRFR